MPHGRLHARIDPAHDRRCSAAIALTWRGTAIGFARIARAAIPATG
jgi:hypothetical protein